jgi:hypothetical protein
MKVAKLNDNDLFTFLVRDPIVDDIAGVTAFKSIRPSDPCPPQEGQQSL